MGGEISLETKVSEEEWQGGGLLGDLEERIDDLLRELHELRREKEESVATLGLEREKVNRLEKRLELLSQDKEKVKIKIDHLLHRLKGVDL
jgi:DNA repair ATPase RecN